ncbi:hypothetical protein I3842_08G110400 [Carya illinoinensis]|uniref:Uncharacterized protein n=1 Tax=Carya illinoinensis TaxID=32201 RepID=A0A922EC78_CARIL|nr:hypothetical protein I3842_08G110400 [Carya illinoinensis]
MIYIRTFHFFKPSYISFFLHFLLVQENNQSFFLSSKPCELPKEIKKVKSFQTVHFIYFLPL